MPNIDILASKYLKQSNNIKTYEKHPQFCMKNKEVKLQDKQNSGHPLDSACKKGIWKYQFPSKCSKDVLLEMESSVKHNYAVY